MSCKQCVQSNGLQTPDVVPVDYEKLFSLSAIRRQSFILRDNAKKMLEEGYIKMGGGFPNHLMFPIAEVDFTLRDGSVVHVGEKMMMTHLQYGLSQGYPDLRQWILAFQKRVHAPPTLDPNHPGSFDLILTNGATEGVNMAFDLMLKEGDWVLVEEATYVSALTMLLPYGARAHGVRTDREGIIKEDLEKILTSWNDLHPGSRKPRLLFVITSCGNPTGITWSETRKRQVYHVARSHDLIILEDDAYFFLQFNRPLIPSFLSMDADGRVVRLDTFSKIIGPGVRVGVASGPAPILQKMRLHKDNNAQGNGLAQAILVQLLNHFGHDGFLRFTDTVMEFYKEKAHVALQCAERHLAGLAEWIAPTGGIFLWLRVPRVKDSDFIVERALKRHVIIVAGNDFQPERHDTAYLRLCYSLVSESDCDQAFRVIRDVIKEAIANGK